MEQGDRDDESEVEPIRDVYVRFFTLPKRAEEDEQINDPDHCQPQSAYHSGSAYSRPWRHANQIAGARHQDEYLITPEDEPRPKTAREPRLARALNDIERSRNEDIAAEGKDDRRRMQRAQPAETREREVGKIEDRREGELQCNDDPTSMPAMPQNIDAITPAFTMSFAYGDTSSSGMPSA